MPSGRASSERTVNTVFCISAEGRPKGVMPKPLEVFTVIE